MRPDWQREPQDDAPRRPQLCFSCDARLDSEGYCPHCDYRAAHRFDSAQVDAILAKLEPLIKPADRGEVLGLLRIVADDHGTNSASFTSMIVKLLKQAEQQEPTA